VRSTRVRTFYNSLITLPNARLINSHVDNYGLRRYRRWSTTISLTYDTPPEKVEAFCEALRELVRLHPYTRKDGYHIYANEFGAHSLEVLFYIFFETPDWATELRERHRMFCDILRVAKQLGVEFALPTQTLHIKRGLPDHADKPNTVDEALRHGRRIGRRALHETLPPGADKPPPVSYTMPTDLSEDEILRLEAERIHGGGN
jgi:MscS family membrane protein